MTLNGFEPEQLAVEWSTRICERLVEIGVPEGEIAETRIVIHTFTKTAAVELAKEPSIALPYTKDEFKLEAEQAHMIIELFLRGVNHSAKELRLTGKSWEDRKQLLETLAWKLFNLAKLLVGFLHVPNPMLQNVFSSPKDLQLMMKQSADVLVKQEISGTPGGPMPFDYPGYR